MNAWAKRLGHHSRTQASLPTIAPKVREGQKGEYEEMQVWRVLLLTGLMALAACTPAPSGTKVTVNVVDSQGNPVTGQAAVYQTGSGAWQALAPSGIGQYTFTVPSGETRYGFTVNCPTGVQASSMKATTYQATTTEATALKVFCPLAFSGSAAKVSGNYNLSAVGGTSLTVYSDTDLKFFSGATGPYEISSAVGSNRELVAVAQDIGGNYVGVKVLRGLNVTAPIVADINFTAADVPATGVVSDFSASLPAGFSVNFGSYFLSSSGVYTALLNSTSGTSGSYNKVPSTIPGDLHWIYAIARGSGGREIAHIKVRANPATESITLPAPIPTGTTVTLAKLPTFPISHLVSDPDFRGYAVLYLWEGLPGFPGGTGAIWQTFVSKGWIGSTTSYTLPDLTSLPGFGGAKPLSGEQASYLLGAFLSNQSVGTLLNSSTASLGYRTGLLHPLYPPRLDGTDVKWALLQGNFTVP